MEEQPPLGGSSPDGLSTVLRVASYACSVLTILVVFFAPLALLFAVAAHVRGDPGGRAAIRTAVLATAISLLLGVVARGLLDVDEIDRVESLGAMTDGDPGAPTPPGRVGA